MRKWDKETRPPKHLCPEKYCFFWGVSNYINGKLCIENKCDEAFKALSGKDCIRRPDYQTPAIDYYEPCEPELERDGLPDDYFKGVTNMDTLPILEFDKERSAVLRPEMLVSHIDAPANCVLCFFPKAIAKILNSYPNRQIGKIMSEDMNLPVYAVEYEGSTLCLVQARVGGPCAAAQMEELYTMGCRNFLACGSCGALVDNLPAGHVIIPTAAVRDEGTSYHYLPPAREIGLNEHCVSVIENTLCSMDISYIKGKTWTTDAVYRETQDRIARRKQEGCIVVEMECASWTAVAQYLNASFGQLLYAGDTLAAEEWDMRDFTKLHDVREQLLLIALQVCALM